jgi:hypothetical protein
VKQLTAVGAPVVGAAVGACFVGAVGNDVGLAVGNRVGDAVGVEEENPGTGLFVSRDEPGACSFGPVVPRLLVTITISSITLTAVAPFVGSSALTFTTPL